MLSPQTRRRLLVHASMAAAFNAAIALAITAFGKDKLAVNMLYSQLIGLSIWALIDIGRFWLHPLGQISLRQAIVVTLLGCVAGYFLGSAAGDMVQGHPPLIGWQKVPQRMAGFLLLSLAAGCALVYFFMSREVLMHTRSEREQAQRQATEAKLKLLQSQLDPHMLFNTLANLRALIPQEPDRAMRMLDQLGDFLRATLCASRAHEHSLQAEFDRLRDYLSLMHIRLGERLRFHLNLPQELTRILVPTLILQSLVENAIVHGLEPKVGGGTVWITASKKEDQLMLQVRDDGIGFDTEAAQDQAAQGFGLAQVRERLHSWYGSQDTINFIAVSAMNTPAIGSINIKNAFPDAPEPTPGCEVTLLLPLRT